MVKLFANILQSIYLFSPSNCMIVSHVRNLNNQKIIFMQYEANQLITKRYIFAL